MTTGDITLTQTTVYYLVQFKSITGTWINAAVDPFDELQQAAGWIRSHIPEHTSRVVRRTVTDEIVEV